MLGFQVSVGAFGREGLQPTVSWLEVVKLQALAAREVASEFSLATAWSWGWGTFGPEGTDADKPAGTINAAAVERHVKVTGDWASASRLLLARLVATKQVAIKWRRILKAERSIIEREFEGRRRLYRGELRRLGIPLPLARNLLADQLRERAILEAIDLAPPTRRMLIAYYREHANGLTRRVTVNPAPAWLGGLKQGHALAASAPKRIFNARRGARLKLRTSEGTFVVLVMGRPKPLRKLKLRQLHEQLAGFLAQEATREVFLDATVKAEQAAIDGAICRRDQLPSADAFDPAVLPPGLQLEMTTGGGAP